ncbi:MAG: 50S ribosomal protein L11 methyltransferase [Pseudomonadota bacterium]
MSKQPDLSGRELDDGVDAPAEAPLWRVTFVVETRDILPLIETLEDEADAVSFFEESADDNDETMSWRVDLLLRTMPDKEGIGQRLDSLLALFDLRCDSLEIEPVDHENWLETLRSPRKPLTVGRVFVHGSLWHGEIPSNVIAIQMDAGMAFGSGDHATTKACLEALNWLGARYRPRQALDLGCGSGLLAIAIAKLWHCRTMATDIDPVAVAVAQANTERNQVDLRVRTLRAEGYRHPGIRRMAPFDLVVANILAQPLIDLAPELGRHLAPGGYSILSGLLDRQVNSVLNVHRAYGLELVRRFDIVPWVALVLRLRRSRRRPRVRANAINV